MYPTRTHRQPDEPADIYARGFADGHRAADDEIRRQPSLALLIVSYAVAVMSAFIPVFFLPSLFCAGVLLRRGRGGHAVAIVVLSVTLAMIGCAVLLSVQP